MPGAVIHDRHCRRLRRVYLPRPSRSAPPLLQVLQGRAQASASSIHALGGNACEGETRNHFFKKSFLKCLAKASAGSGSSVTHVYAAEGTFQVTATGSAGAEAISTSVRIGNLTGVWLHIDAPAGVNQRLIMTQEGNRLIGQWVIEFQPGSPFGTPENPTSSTLSGTIANPRSVIVSQGGECLRTGTGTASADLTVITARESYGNPVCLIASPALSFSRQ